MGEKKNYSIAEVARICGVSKATVSRVINNISQGVGPETREKVLQTIRELNYRPNALARSVATSKSGTIGLIIPDVSNFFFPAIIRGVTDYMDSCGYSVIVANSDYDPEREAQQLLRLVDRRVDGILLCTGVSNKDFLQDFRKHNIPLALLGRNFDNSCSDASIIGDNVRGAYKSASHLMKNGSRRVVYVEGNPHTAGSRQRLEGYKQAHKEFGIPVREEFIISGEYSIAFGQETAKKLLESGLEFDAVITGSDLIAIGILAQLMKSGVRVPEDVEIIGFDNIELTTVVSPSLSTISKPHYEMAQHISEQLIRIIQGETIPLPHTVVEPQLILRETTRNAE
jgi:LacI family transcriptional regulator